MKKLLAVLLAVVMMLSICACAPEDTDATGGDDSLKLVDTGTGFRVGYARVDITPDEPVPLSGYGNNQYRVSQQVLDRIYVSCAAITDEQDNTIMMFSIDLQRSREETWYPARETLSALTGIPEENITLTATHTHSSVDQGASDNDVVDRWEEELTELTVQCGIQALNDRKSCSSMQIGSVETSGLNFIRHYTTLSGGYVGDSFGSWTESPLTGHTTENDPTMHLIRFVRDEAKDIVMVNWRAHAALTGSKTMTNLSSDFIGPFREVVEAGDTDTLVVYYNGASGNVNPTSHIQGETAAVGTAKADQYIDHGTQLANYCLEGLANNMTEVEIGLIQTQRRIVAGEVNHELEDKLLEAKAVQKHYATYRDNDLTEEYAAQFGIRTAYHANAIIARSSMDATKDMELNALSIGEHVGFVQSPFEMFTSTSVETEEGSPFDMTFVMGYSNAMNTYIPDDQAWEYTCYESDVTWFVKGTSNMIRDQWLSMLDDLHSNAS